MRLPLVLQNSNMAASSHQNINDETFNEIYKAFVDYHVIGILDQNLNSDEYLEFGRKWGEIHHYPYMKGLETHPEILEILKILNVFRF